MFNWILKAFYPIGYQAPKKPDPFEYEIGETVAVYDGWEVPLFHGIVEDRRVSKWTLRHPSGDTSSYSEVLYVVNGKEYGRRALRKASQYN